MIQDPSFDRAAAKAAGYTDAEIDAYLAAQKPSAPSAAARPSAPRVAAESTSVQPASKPEVPTQRLRAAIGQGAMMGFGDEAEALARSLFGKETYSEAVQDVRDKLAAYREDRPVESMGMELAGGLATGIAGAGRTLVGRGIAKATGSAIGQGLLSGAGSAEGGVENRLKGAAIGGGAAIALPVVGKAIVSKVPGASAAGQVIGRGASAVQRAIANVAERSGLGGVARAVEPLDMQRIQREAAEALPGGAGARGVTTASMPTGTAATRTAEQEAAIAAEQAKGKARSAAAAEAEAKRKASEAVEQAKREASASRALTGQRAEAIAGMGASRGQKLAATAKEAKAAAREATRTGASAASATVSAARDEAKAAAQDVIDQAKQEAGAVIGELRGQQPRGTARQLQESVRKQQLAEAEGHYEAVRQIGAPPEVDPEIYLETFADPVLSSAFNKAQGDIAKGVRNVKPGTPARAMPRMVSVNGQDVPELTLEGLDLMRRNVIASRVTTPGTVGLSASQSRQALQTIDRLEERFLAGYGADDAANALRTAREAYRGKFKILEAVQDGLNLGSAKAGRASGILLPSRKELDEVAQRVAQMTDTEREAFQVGAREWFDRALQEANPDALSAIKRFATKEADQRRLALAFGDDAVATIQQFAPEVVGKRAAAASQAVRGEAEQLAAQIAEGFGGVATKASSRAARAEQLAQRAVAEKGARAQQLVEQSRASGGQSIINAQRAAGADVGAAREARKAAQTEAQKTAEALTQARIARQQAKGMTFGDLDKALGNSDAQQTFLQRLYPRMDQAQRRQAVAVLGSKVQNELQDLARANAPVEQVLARVNALRQNDAVRTLFGSQIDQFVQSLSPNMASRVGSRARPSLTGLLGRGMGRNFNEQGR